jgi:transposase
MMSRAVEFTEEDVERLAFERFHHPHPRVQRKLEGVYLKAKGLSHEEVCDLLNISRTTLWGWLRDFQADGIEGLQRWEAQGTTSELAAHADAICEHLVAHPPHTIAAAQAAIEELTGIRRSETQIRQLLRRLGFQRLKTGSLPAKADPKAQARFKKKCLSRV